MIGTVKLSIPIRLNCSRAVAINAPGILVFEIEILQVGQSTQFVPAKGVTLNARVVRGGSIIVDIARAADAGRHVC